MRRTDGTWRQIGAMAGLVALVASCGGVDDDDGPGANIGVTVDAAEGATEIGDATVDSAPVFVRTSEVVEPSDSGDDGAPVVAAPGSTTTTTVFTIPLVSDTGVPGIDSDDVFCRSWSQFAGSFRAIGLVSAIRDVDAGLRLEVIASDAVVAAIAGMGVALPAELEPERDTLLSEFAGPFGRRALKARDALTAAGLGDDDVELLTDVWLVTLARVGIDDPSLDIELPEGVSAAAVDEATTSFAATTPAIRADPSLTTFTQIPLTDDYTFANCPDGGTLSGNDDL